MFAAITRGLFLVDLPMDLVWLASRAISDEIRHGELCRHAAAKYSGEAPPTVTAHGFLPADEVSRVVDQALVDLVFPGFAHVGIDPGPVARVLDET